MIEDLKSQPMEFKFKRMAGVENKKDECYIEEIADLPLQNKDCQKTTLRTHKIWGLFGCFLKMTPNH